MIRKVQVVVFRTTREAAIVDMEIDDDKGTHADVYRMAAEKADAEDKAWRIVEEHIDNFASHFDWVIE